MSAAGWAAFLLAAGLGASARHLVDACVQDRSAGAFPWGTLVVNVTGCFALGVLAGLGLHHDLPASWTTVLGAGAMGAYTTFSTFTFETVRLAQQGALPQAITNVAASLVSGLVAVSAGLALTAV